MAANFLSEVARIKPSRRDSAYRGYLRRRGVQDTLQNRLDAKVGLSDEDVQEIALLLGKHCGMRTFNAIRWALMATPDRPNYGLYGRIIKTRFGWEYCAGQSYTDEIRRVRELLLK